MKRLLLTTLLLSFLIHGNAQRFDYENTSKLFFGVNVGRTWHTSDVENVKKRFPLGAGFVFGGSINQDYGKAVSFDIRLRYLGGNWYGQDSDTTSAIQNNHAVKKYYDTLGYTVQNFKATQHRLALELSVHANRFKERTGFDPYIFAGIGVTGTRTKGDLLKKTNSYSEGAFYPYNESPNGNIIDKDYTVVLDKNEDGESYENERLEANIMPSLGIGIGYYFNSRFSIGIEHKSTFFLGDYFDGTTVNQNGMPGKNIENDIYHYTGIYLKWYFKTRERHHVTPKENAHVPPVEPSKPIVDSRPDTSEPTRKRPPIVTFTNPGSSPFRSSSPTYTLRADIQFVNSANNLTFTRNGENYSTFIFNPMTRVFESNVELNVGENVFTLKGVNPDGNDSDRVVIIYQRNVQDRPNPPVVNIVDPAVRPHSVNQLNYILKADIQNISTKNQLTVTFNNQDFTDFSFNPGGNINFNANLNLNAGVNTFKIVGTNNAGMDLDEAVIIYTREATDNTGYPPVVKIITPNANPYTTGQLFEKVVAKVDHVNSKQQIEVKINGVSTTNFTFNTATKRVQLDANLSIGTNTIIVSAHNPYGNDLDKTQIIYRRGEGDTGNAGNPPKVLILSPNVNPYSATQAVVNVIAEIENVDSKNQIEIKLNGVNTTNFTYNNATKLVQMNTDLTVGNNSVIIRATNAYGNHADNVQITYRKEGVPPSVKILTPNVNPYTTAQTPSQIVAEVKEVTSKSQINVLVNGFPVQDFTYTNSTNRVQFNANITEGNNSVSIKASNIHGTDLDDVLIIYRRGGTDSGSTKTPPKVKITTPNTNPYRSQLASIDLIAQIQNIENKEQVEVKINGASTTNFTYNNVSKFMQVTVTLNSGSNIVSVKATNVDGSDLDETQIIYKQKEEPRGKPPVVSFITPNAEYKVVELPSYSMIAKVENVTKKSDVTLYFNENLVDPNEYTFNPSMQTIKYLSSLVVGNNTYKVIGNNPFGSHQAIEKIERKVKTGEVAVGGINEVVKPRPCDKPSISITSPASTTILVENASFSIQGALGHISNPREIKVFFNGKRDDTFIFNAVSKSFIHKLDLVNGENTYFISLTNTCATVEKEFVINYEAPQSCGVQVDLGSTDSDFCLITPAGTFTRNTLMTDPSFVYNGEAKVLYFKARENGLATVNGEEYTILKDNYYYFAGQITVDIGRNKPGSVGQWVVCIEGTRPPIFGKGDAKPASPCETPKTEEKPNVSKPATPVIKERPAVKETPIIRERPTRNNENTRPGGERAKPTEPTRNPR